MENKLRFLKNDVPLSIPKGEDERQQVSLKQHIYVHCITHFDGE